MNRQNESALRDKAKAGILSGRLPSRSSSSCWGGPGAGESCDLCGAPITKDDIEMELDATQASKDSRFHINCYAIWREVSEGGVMPHKAAAEAET